MTPKESSLSCAFGCWITAGLASLIGFGLLIVLGEYQPIQAAFVAILVAAVGGGFLAFALCRSLRPGGLDTPNTTAAGTAGGVDLDTRKAAARAAVAQVRGETPKQEAPKKVAAPAPAAPKPAPTPEPAAPAASDGPVRMDGPRDGKPDNLKEIKGIGPKLEQLVNSMGFYHFDQIANWSAADVAWVDENLEGFKGRVTRDDWVAQAKILASGGETEFSKRVEDGDVY